MMVNKQKRKGTAWEKELVDRLNQISGVKAKRVAGSGALGTQLDEPSLMSDVKATFSCLPKGVRIECKTGYGGASSLTLQREWLEKVKLEAEKTYSYPMLAAKFSGARGSIKHFIVIDLETFAEIMESLNESLGTNKEIL